MTFVNIDSKKEKEKGTITIINWWHGPYNIHANVWKDGKTFVRNLMTKRPHNIHANIWKDGQTFVKNLRTTTNIILPYSQGYACVVMGFWRVPCSNGLRKSAM